MSRFWRKRRRLAKLLSSHEISVATTMHNRCIIVVVVVVFVVVSVVVAVVVVIVLV